MKAQLSKFVIAYEHYGNGTPIIFIHGYPLCRRLWDKQLADLSDIARVIAPDLRGFGESQSTKGIYTMEILAEDCKDLLDTLGIEQPVILCGLSMGGYICLAFYKKYRTRVAGMILTSTRAGADTPDAKANRELSIANVKESGTTPILDGMLSKLLASTTYHSHPEIVAQARYIMQEATSDGVIGALAGMKDREDYTLSLSNIDIPVLIIHGQEDQLISHNEAEYMAKMITGSQLMLIPNAGHLVNIEQPDLFNHCIRNYLQSNFSKNN